MVGLIDVVPTQHLLHRCVGLRKDATQLGCWLLMIGVENKFTVLRGWDDEL